MTPAVHHELVPLFDESFSRAADVLGVVDQELMVAGRPVVVRYAGSEMRSAFCRPFTHLEQGHDGKPGLTVLVWDGADSMTPPPPLPLLPPEAEEGHRSIVKSDNLQVEYTIGPGMLTAIAPQQRRAWVWIADRRSVPFWEAASPFKMIWMWWLAESGHTLLHAGAVADESGGVLFVGSSGRGKSTTTVACLEAGFSFVGDDYVVLDADGETIHSLYCTAKLEDDHARRFARSARTDIREGPGDVQTPGKRVLLLTDAFPGQVLPNISIDAVAATRLGLDRPSSRFAPLAAAPAMLATSASTILQLGDGQPTGLASMARLVERTPTYSLLIGSDTGQIPSAVEQMIRESTHV